MEYKKGKQIAEKNNWSLAFEVLDEFEIKSTFFEYKRNELKEQGVTRKNQTSAAFSAREKMTAHNTEE